MRVWKIWCLRRQITSLWLDLANAYYTIECGSSLSEAAYLLRALNPPLKRLRAMERLLRIWTK